MSEVRHDSEKTERRTARKVVRVLGDVAGMAAAVAPWAGVAAFETTSVTKTLPIVGLREFTFSPNLRGEVIADTGMHGKIRKDLKSDLVGVDIEVGHVPVSSSGQPEQDDFAVLSSAAETLLKLDKKTLTTTGNVIKDEMIREMELRFLRYELGGLAVLGIHNRLRKDKRYSAALIGGLSITTLAGYAPMVQYEALETWAAIATPLGVVYSNDSVTTALIRKASSGVEDLNKKRLKNNERFIENSFEQSIPFLDEIIASRGENDIIISYESDMHTAEVMTQIAVRSDEYVKPDVKLRGGDMSNINNVFEVATVVMGIEEDGTPTIAVLGNHDGNEIKDAMEKAGAIFPDGKLVTIENPRTGQKITILGMDDPRVTKPGDHGTAERSEGAVEKMQAKLLEAARTLQPDIIMLHEPADIQFLRENGIQAKLWFNGHTHVEDIEDTASGESLQSGDAGGIGVRDITNILTPYGRPGTDARRYYIRYNTLLNRPEAIYTLTYNPNGTVTREVHTISHPLTIPEKADRIIQHNRDKLDSGNFRASQ